MVLNIIHDSRFFDRYEPLMEELKRQGIEDFKIWEAITDRKTVVESINASHKMIVRWAKENDMEEVLIGEDDLMIPNENGFKYFMDNKPESYSIYLGGSYLIDNRIEYKAPNVVVPEWAGNQLVMIHKRYYDTFLNLPDEAHIDSVQRSFGRYVLCFPMVALQRPARSANHQNEIVNYNPVIPKGYIYE